MTKSSLIQIAGSVAAIHLCLTGCEAEDDLELDFALEQEHVDTDLADELDAPADPEHEPRSSCWPPQTIDPALCENAEEEPSLPPEDGECKIELTLTKSSFVTGQLAPEGRGEISFTATATPLAPAGAVVNASSPEKKYSVHETKHHDLSLGTYTVPVGAAQAIEVCVDFTEDDNGGVLGQDDLGTACQNVVLECDPVVGQPTFTRTVGPTALCGPNQCLGSAAAEIKVMRVDADNDCVPNYEDTTPELCDEYFKGTEGVGLLLYFHYDDPAFNALAQSIGTNMSKHFGAYDYVALVADNGSSNILNTSGQAFRNADLVYEPTREGFRAAIRDLTAAGLRFDVFVHAHGYPNGANDSEFEVISGDRITGDWLWTEAQPASSGTALGGIPIVAFWSTTCFAERIMDTFDQVGAIAVSGAFDIYFEPNSWGTFWDNWVLNNDTYRTAVDASVTPGVALARDTFLVGQGAVPPYNCVGNTVLGDNPCAENFFNDDMGANEAQYNLESFYDDTLSGSANVNVSSERTFDGIEAVRFGGGMFVWP